MTTTISDRAERRSVTASPAAELERLNRTVYDAPGRPCAAVGADPEWWFPEEPRAGRRTRARAKYEARALQLCRGCPVQLGCLELALLREGRQRGFGIAGGTAPWQRQAIKASRELAVRS
jgi:hypothetical protein